METVPVEIRMMILNHLPNKDLLECSLVSKRFNYEARSVLRSRGSLITSFKLRNPCEQMEDFISMLKHMSVIPLSGICFRMYGHHREDCQPWTAELTDRIYKELRQLPWKQLSLFFVDERWWENKSCPAFRLAKRVLTDYSGVLEKLSLYVAAEREEFIQEVFQDSRFPRLKVLSLEDGPELISSELDDDDDDDDRDRFNYYAYNNYIKALVGRTPNLKELHITNDIDLMDNVLEGSSAVLWVDDEYFETTEMISESLVGAIRLENLTLGIYDREFSVERYNRITPMLLEASSQTLSSVSVVLEFALPLMCHGVCLANVRKFKMNCDNYQHLIDHHPGVLEIVKQFDFTRIFPTLTEASISCVSKLTDEVISPNVLDEFVEHANAILKAPLPDRAVNIKKLNLKTSLHGVPFYREMFPDVGTISTSAIEGASASYRPLWENWIHLKALEIDVKVSYEGENLDSAFCGIFPEEVAELRGKDEEYLRRVNIVPVMPSITCLKDLRNLKLHWGSNASPQYKDPTPTAIFSKVTCLIVFARLPTLAVTLKTSIPELPQVLSHLKPHVSIDVEASERGAAVTGRTW